MMLKIKVLIRLLALSIILINTSIVRSYSQCENWLWIRGTGDIGGDEARDVTTDIDQNVYIVGNYSGGAISFGTINLSGSWNNGLYIAKYDTTGNVLWAKGAGGSKLVNANGVISDDSGYVYIVGDYSSNSLVFGKDTLTNSSGGYNMFVAKFDRDGNNIWAFDEIGGTANEIAVDKNGNIYVVGEFAGGENIIMYDSSGSRNWSKTGGIAKCVTVYQDDKYVFIYLAGQGFLAKYDPTGFNHFNKTLSGDYLDITTNASGKIYIVSRAGGRISKFGPDGNTETMVCAGANSLNAHAYGVSSDNFGNIYMAGAFKDSIRYCGQPYYNINYPNDDIFMIKYDYNGNLLQTVTAGHLLNESIQSVTTDNHGNIYIAGYYTDSLKIGTLPVRVSADSKNSFLIRLENVFRIDSISVKHNICYGDSAGYIQSFVKSGMPPYSYSWTPNNETTKDIYNLEAGTYTLTVFDSTGCKASRSVSVTQPSLINLSFSTTSSSGSNGAIDLSVSGGSPPYTYSWSNGAITQDISGLDSGWYSVTVTDTNGCTRTDSANVDSIHHVYKPIAGFTVNNDTQCIIGNSYVFTNTSTVVSGTLTYKWSIGDTLADSTLQDITHSYSALGNYTVRLIVTAMPQNTSDTFTKTIHVVSGPTPSFTFTNTCLGDTTYFQNTTSTTDSVLNYYWDYGDGSTAIVWGNTKHYYDTAGTYRVSLKILLASLCEGSDTQTLVVNPSPIVNLPFDADTSIAYGSEITITATGNFASILWSTSETTGSITVADSGIYNVSATGSNGCVTEKTFYINYLPEEAGEIGAYNTLSPNGDGINDLFIIPNLNFLSPVEVKIYNKWGDEIYSTTDYQNDWDAKFEGSYIPQGTYYYVIKTNEDKVYKGTINIIR